MKRFAMLTFALFGLCFLLAGCGQPKEKPASGLDAPPPQAEFALVPVATLSERAAIREHFGRHASVDATASDAIDKLRGHPLAMRMVENHIHREMVRDKGLQGEIAAYQSRGFQQAAPTAPNTQPTPAPVKHQMLLWLWDHKDQILAFVLQILKLFGI